MAANATFDVGPLSWVKSEIEHSLAEARAHLDKFQAQPGEAKEIKLVLTHLHQVTGALSMVGLGAATRFNEETERLVASMEQQPATVTDGIAATRAAIAALSGYLDALMAGEPDRPMSLAKTYLAVNQARGASDASESDLFSPDLSVVMPAGDGTILLPKAEMMVDTIRQWRGAYQSGLLKLLRDKDIDAGLRGMRSATLAIEALQVTSPTRAFWYAAGGFFDALAANSGDAGALAVQLLGKIDQQIKLLIDGVQRVPEKLFRELLLVVGRSNATTERVQRIREMYRLKELLATPEVGGGGPADEKTHSTLRMLREQIQAQKEQWLKFTSGTRPALEPFVQYSDASAQTAGNLGNKDIAPILNVVAAVAAELKRTGAPVNESLGLEVATALLFAEASVENYSRLGPDFTLQSAGVITRVKAAMGGVKPAAFDSKTNPLMDTMSKLAQEKMLIFQVGQEVQTNLQQIETTLDAYFRDPAKVTGLATLAPLFTQIQGALQMLEFDEAAGLNRLLQERVAKIASGAERGNAEASEAVADGVSGLGLFVAALQQGAPNPREALLPALVRWNLVAPPASVPTHAQGSPISAADIDVQKQKVQVLYEEWKQSPEQTTTRDQLREAVAELKQDAEIVADNKSVRQSDEALKAIDANLDPNVTGVSAVLHDIAPAKPPEAPTIQTVQLVDAPTAKIDKELLEIFLEEATEVVSTIRENAKVLSTVPGDREAFSTIRRGYHTLKGSGRMVGLKDLGEVAWSCEQVFNKALKDETYATPGLQRFIGLTTDAFSGWVEELKTSGSAHIDGTEIARLADLLKSGQEPDFKPDVEAEKAVAPPVITPPPLPVTPTLDSLPAQSLVPPPIPAPAEIREQEVVVGSIVVPAQLFEIYMGEAESQVITLDNEMVALETKPTGPVSHEFMRAAHTLNSSSLTTGFTMIADVASALEKWSQAVVESPPVWNAHRLGVTRQAVDALGSMVLGLHAKEMPAAQPDIILALTTLRETHAAERDSAVSSHFTRPAAVTETVATPPPLPVATDAASLVPPPIPVEMLASPPPPPPPIPVQPPVIHHTTPPPIPSPAVVASATAAGALAMVAAHVASKGQGVRVGPAPAAEQSAATQTPRRGVELGRDRRNVADDIDADLFPIFLAEAREITPQVGDGLRAWRADPANHMPVTGLARHLHTLKGSSRMAGLMRLGELAHVLETRVIDMDREIAPSSARFDAVDDLLDRFNAVIERFAAGDVEAPIEIPVLAEFSSELPAPLAKLAAARAEIVAEVEKLEGRERQSLLRVNADLIDRFVNDAGELAIARSRIDLEIQAFKRAMVELGDNVNRMKSQLREIEIQAESQIQSRIKEKEEQGTNFDPLEFDRFSRTQELTRFLAESLNDVVTLQQSLQNNLDEADAALLQQARINTDLQQGLMGVRLVPLGNLQDRFYRVVRQTAKELDKKANLEFRGVRVEIDRSVLEKITAPLEHLLRNAVAHGLETPAERVAAGKDEIGEIALDAQQVGNEVILTLSDDGGGLNFARIREIALQQGLIRADEAVDEVQLSQLIFKAGFTTAAEVTAIAGRGVGMDVVRNEIVALGGRVDISTAPGRGTTFTIALPLTLAVTQAVMVVVGETMYAIPAVMIEQVQEYKGKRYEVLLTKSEIEWKNNRYPLRSMQALLGGTPSVSALSKASVILAKSGQQRAAIQVDDIIGNREIVVKTIGPQLARIGGVTGATVLGSGQIVLIINPVQLVYPESAIINVEPATTGLAPRKPVEVMDKAPAVTAVSTLAATPAPQSLAETIAASTPGGVAMPIIPSRTTRLVMVVDDSLTVRKITSRMLAREGFEVATAKDGVDGLEQLQELSPDLILLDIEMPRMDGFEFARNVRLDPRIKHIPIIMITSRTADKHRNRAIELGVNEYMGKPYQEEQLLGLIRQHTGLAAVAG